jgi:hypothetical protein
MPKSADKFMTINYEITDDKIINREAGNFAKYILRRPVDKVFIERYKHIIQGKQLSSISVHDNKLLEFALNHRWAIGLIDSYLAIFKPDSEFRRRLFVMFAILESSQDYEADFLPARHSAIYGFYILYIGLKSTVKIPCGFIVSTMVKIW